MTDYENIVCDNCKRGFSLFEYGLCEHGVTINGEDLTLVYFVCPFCRKLYFVSLKDDAFEGLANELGRAKMRIKNNSGKVNEERMAVFIETAYRKQRRLEVHLRKLRRKYPGTFTVRRASNGADEIVYVP